MTQHPSGSMIKADRKLLLVPLVFIFLRVWDIADDIFIVYANHHLHGNSRNWLKLCTVSLQRKFYIATVASYSVKF